MLLATNTVVPSHRTRTLRLQFTFIIDQLSINIERLFIVPGPSTCCPSSQRFLKQILIRFHYIRQTFVIRPINADGPGSTRSSPPVYSRFSDKENFKGSVIESGSRLKTDTIENSDRIPVGGPPNRS